MPVTGDPFNPTCACNNFAREKVLDFSWRKNLIQGREFPKFIPRTRDISKGDRISAVKEMISFVRKEAEVSNVELIIIQREKSQCASIPTLPIVHQLLPVE